MGSDLIYAAKARQLGQILVRRNIQLVYGGGNIGLMGAIADEVLQQGGRVVGVIPKFLQEKEVAHEGLSELIVVDTMHERKMTMNNLCDGVMVLPGGFGTMEEFFEMITWGQLGLHHKPIGLLNVAGFYDNLIAQMDRMLLDGFLSERNRQLLISSSDVEELVDRMSLYKPSISPQWMSGDET